MTYRSVWVGRLVLVVCVLATLATTWLAPTASVAQEATQELTAAEVKANAEAEAEAARLAEAEAKAEALAAAKEDEAVKGLDLFAQFQHQSVKNNQSTIAHWGWDKSNYTLWGTHSNRLIPVYTFGTLNAGEGIDLNGYIGENSVYRDAKALQRLYRRADHLTLNPNAQYMDQTNIFSIQQAALEAGKKNIILVVFDGMDWHTTRAAAIAKNGKVQYNEGRGTGLHMLDYQANGTTQFGYMVTSAFCDEMNYNVDTQQVAIAADTLYGGYDFTQAGETPWSMESEVQYLVGTGGKQNHAYTDSASSATSMTAGIKTYNAAIGVAPDGSQAVTIAHAAQKLGYKVGVVSSVPISHATPAAAYSHNVNRNDYQDLTRDLLGLPSISHPKTPLPGMDVVIGGGYGTERDEDSGQGANFVPGNGFLTAADLATVTKSEENPAGKYRVARRLPGVDGSEHLLKVAKQAAATGDRLLGFYGASDNGGHLPYATADGDYRPVQGRSKTREVYDAADLEENPTLDEMAVAALEVLSKGPNGLWLMVEAGDVDWANHDDNLDNSIGAVLSGDRAVKAITQWVEQNSNWQETVMIVTADHGHYLVIEDPEALANMRK